MDNIAVVIPAYNAEKTINRCVESVLNQTFQDFQIYIVDDCSTDSTWKLIQELQAKDKRIHTTRLETNNGPSCARNAALDKIPSGG